MRLTMPQRQAGVGRPLVDINAAAKREEPDLGWLVELTEYSRVIPAECGANTVNT